VPREVTEATRRLVIERAGGRCEYCLIDQAVVGFPHQIDHIVSRKHGGSSRLGNLAYACVLCNRYKGTDIAARDHSGDVIRVFDPRRDEWQQHFSMKGPTIQPLTPIGEATVRLLRLNAAERVVERQLLQSLGLYPRQ
jgi:HNH endonuclease